MKRTEKLFTALITVSIIFGALLFMGYDSNAQQYPPGNYKKTCTDLLKIGHMLEAKCQKKDGTWQSTVLFYGRCDGPIHNDDGQLTCKMNGGGGNWLPPGNYKETCRNMRVNGDRLNAECQRREGSWRFTSIEYDECYSDITNQNGQLTCGQRHHHNMLPKGSYRKTCQDISINGDVLDAQCQKRDGSWRWTSIDFGDCYGEIVNENGRLVCE